MRTGTVDLIFVTAMAAGMVYFTVGAMFGETGGARIDPLNHDIDGLEREIRDLTAERDALAHRNAALAGPEIDLDLLEERLRAAHGLADPRDALIIEDATP